MKPSLVLLLCVLLAQAAPATILQFLGAPHDNGKVRESIESRPEVVALRKDYFAFQNKYFWPLLNSEMPAIFGRKLKDLPDDYVLPSFQSDKFWTTGVFDVSQPQKRHVDYYRVGDLGFVEFVFHQDGERVHAAVVFFRADAEFVPLRSKRDLPRRVAWEKKKWKRTKSWIIEHLPKKHSSNQSVELTATRLVSTLQMPKTSSLRAKLALGGGSSLLSR